MSELGERLNYILTSRDGGEAITSWEFTPEELNAEGGTTKPLGVLVENIANARPGSYGDKLDFKVSAKSAILVGSKITFGKNNGADLTWRILAVDEANNRALLITEQALEKRAYHSSSTSITWENCSLRS